MIIEMELWKFVSDNGKNNKLELIQACIESLLLVDIGFYPDEAMGDKIPVYYACAGIVGHL